MQDVLQVQICPFSNALNGHSLDMLQFTLCDPHRQACRNPGPLIDVVPKFFMIASRSFYNIIVFSWFCISEYYHATFLYLHHALSITPCRLQREYWLINIRQYYFHFWFMYKLFLALNSSKQKVYSGLLISTKHRSPLHRCNGSLYFSSYSLMTVSSYLEMWTTVCSVYPL